MPATPNTNATKTKATCACDSVVRCFDDIEAAPSACVGEAAYEHKSKRFCVMHYPSQNKIEAFRVALEGKIVAQDFNFCGVYFPEDIDFLAYNEVNDEPFFFTADADFRSATFSGNAKFGVLFSSNVYFNSVKFRGSAWFYGARFSGGAYFQRAEFRRATYFQRTKFCGEAHFESVKFGGKAGFKFTEFIERATFNDAKFSEKINFTSATFRKEALFKSVNFGGELAFTSATFSREALFESVNFGRKACFKFASFIANADFSSGTFSGESLFDATRFLGAVDFTNAQFKDYVKFKHNNQETFGEKASLNFDSLRIEKPERLSFHSLKLRPHWFINTDPRKFEFIDVDFGQYTLAQEREACNSDRLLSIAYRQLAVNAEENSRYEEAMKFRSASMEASFYNLQEKWRNDWVKTRWKNFSYETFFWWWDYVALRKFFSLTWWYRFLSEYSESPARAAIILLLVLCFSCVPYWLTDFSLSKQEQRKTGVQQILAPDQRIATQIFSTFVYSLETASLQKPEPRPVTTAARFFVGMETILAPLQAALLALAIRRKYMR